MSDMINATENTVTNETAPAVAEKGKNKLFNLLGEASGVSHRTSTIGTRYFYMKFATTLNKKPATLTAMAFGKAYEAIKDAVAKGGAIRLNGFFSTAPDGGKTFTVVGMGQEPQAKEAVAA